MKKIVKESLPYVFILIAVLLIRFYVVTPIKVNGMSMYDTLDGSEIMLLWRQKKIQRYDIVVADLIENDKKVDTIIKRVYGLPGETIKCEDGILYINDHKIEDAYAYGKTDDFRAVTLQKDEYFILGDNREISLDSHIFGPEKKENIKGVADFILFPFSKFGKIASK